MFLLHRAFLAMTARVETQIERMNDIVRYQLRKPATIHTESLGVASVAIDRELTRLAENIVGIDGYAGGGAAWLANEDLIVPIEEFLPNRSTLPAEHVDAIGVIGAIGVILEISVIPREEPVVDRFAFVHNDGERL